MADNTDTTDAPDTIAAIEAANIANIVAKLKAGKVITRDEEKRLREYQEREAAKAAGKSAVEVAGKVADSMEQAAALSGLSKETLKRAKEAGCPAFRGSRVYVDELVEWMEENGDTLPTGNTELDAINLEIARQKLRKVRFAQDIEEGKYFKAEDEAPKIEALGLELKDTLRRRLEEEMPERCANRSREELAEFGKQLVDELCAHFQKGAAAWLHKTK